MNTVRIWFTKTGEASYISLLDLQRVMGRALKRSGLPVWYTLGFNPHIYMTFTCPLSLGQESLVVRKKSKKAKAGFTEVDLIPLIYSWNLEVQRDTMTLDAVLAAQNPGLNPELIRAAFCETYPDLQPDFVTFHRRAVLDGEGKEFR